jgi:DNA recombination protein RmuC
MLSIVAVIGVVAGVAAGWFVVSARKNAELQGLTAERDLARGERERSEVASSELRARLEESQQARAAAETRVAYLEASRAESEQAFAVLAQSAVAKATESLVQLNKTQVDGSLSTNQAQMQTLLQPLTEMLDQYRGELLKSERSRVEAYGGLQEQIRALLGAQESAQREASRLANALQSPTVRGSWGESSLKRCVELAGMSEFCDFDAQETFTNDEGRRLRPDLIVRLPNNRVIAVDAKVPLTEYQAAANEPDETRKREFLLLHAKTLRRHIDSLSRREYQTAVGESLDFTVMFIPGEHFLSAAYITDPTLFDYSVQRNVFVASPVLLLPLLRAINAGWKAERTEENAKRMHDAGVELFNRFVKVMELLSEVGGAIEKSVEKYNTMIRSIDARLWPKGQELQRMAGSGKELGEMRQLEIVPLESARLRLSTQQEDPGDVLPFEKE